MHMLNTQHLINTLMLSSIVLVILLMIPITRSIIAYLISRVIHPMLEAILKHLFLRIWSVILGIWRAHWTLLRNLSTPKDRIYPDLEKQLEQERKEKVKASL